jgi:hypothetical protein
VPSQKDTIFGKLAVERGYATQERVVKESPAQD